MEREIMEQEITEYAERHDFTAEELRCFVVDITGSAMWDQEGRTLSLLTPSELKLVHGVVVTHNSWDQLNQRRAS